ncbi:MAG: hypothetical protein U0800_21290 [Isosphaeraceae bacterium]
MSPERKPDGPHPEPRGNALRHGLSGAGVVLPENLRIQVDLRRRAYTRTFPPADQLDLDDIDTAALGWVRFLECRSEITYRAVVRSDMAVGKWDLLRRIDAQDRAKRLAHNPPSVVARLKATFGGVLWLLEQWRMLKATLDFSEKGEWSAKQQERAQNLAGVDRIFRDDDHHKIRSGGVDDRRKLVEGQMAELNELLADGELERLDAIDRRVAIDATHALNDPSYERLRLYEQRAYRSYERAIRRLQERQRLRNPEPPPPGRRGSRFDREAAEAFEATIDREIAEAGGNIPATETGSEPATEAIDAQDRDAEDTLAARERDDLKAVFAARLASPEVQGRVTDDEMALLDDESLAEFRAWHAQLGLSIDLSTAVRGMIGMTRIQAEEGGYEDPNAEFFASVRQKSELQKADRERRDDGRDRKRERRKATKAARKRNRRR